MKKSQKERIKKGGEEARLRYEQFMQAPWWMREHFSQKHRDDLIAFLTQTYNDELKMVNLLLDEHRRLIAEDKENHIRRPEFLDEAGDRALRLNAVKYLISTLKDRGSLRGPDLTLYCRDN